jgi:hypothetical protein
MLRLLRLWKANTNAASILVFGIFGFIHNLSFKSLFGIAATVAISEGKDHFVSISLFGGCWRL